MEPTTYKLQHEGNRYWTEPILSESEWLDILHFSDSNKNEMQLNALLMFFYQPGHKATCSAVGKTYSLKAESVRNLVMNFGRSVVKNCGKGFRIETTESEKDTYWCVPMLGKKLKDHFEWELRPELVAALRIFLIEKLIAEYRGPVLKEGLDNSRSRESYKWRLLSSAKEKSIPEVLDVLTCQEMNILTWRTKDSIKAAQKTSPEQLENCFSKLLSAEGDFYQKFSAFVSAGREFLSKQDADRILREKEAALFLACINPAENAVYKWTLYQMAASYLGLEIDNKRPYDAFVKILNAIIPIEKKDSELVEKIKEETKGYFWSDLLNAQDVLWQTRSFMRNSRPKNWLQRFYESRLKDPNSAFNGWFENSYSKNVEAFISFIKDENSRSNPDRELQDLLLKKSNNGISDIGSGQFNAGEYTKILQDWESVYDILKSALESENVTPEAFKSLEDLLNPKLIRYHPQAIRRIWCGLFPDLLSSVTEPGILRRVHQIIQSFDSNVPDLTNNWLKDNLALMEYFKVKVSFVKPRHRAVMAMEIVWNTSYFENNNDMEKYIELLESNKNLILTGAPGTGKTKLAQMIAKAMGDNEPGFVQFHPSYDYTDFVEGLRPNEDGTFERVNGVFKQFCADALSSVSSGNFDDAYNLLLADLTDLETPMQVNTYGYSSSSVFGIMVNSKGSLDLFTKPISQPEPVDTETLSPVEPGVEFKKNGSLTKERIRECDSQIYWKGYYKGVYQLLVQKYGLKPGTKEGPKKHVFIIDEINRGELSKIFGELFFAIDPGYRGADNRVKTQYQNLVPPGDPFDKGFFVPENVYIIGTMNDIDRGVESFDFAIRRRFGWYEVSANERMTMLDEEIPEWAEAAKKSLLKLNEVIVQDKKIGLSSAYEIGPAYYLKLKHYNGDFEQLWKLHIRGILFEYLRGTRDIEDKLENILKPAFESYKA